MSERISNASEGFLNEIVVAIYKKLSKKFPNELLFNFNRIAEAIYKEIFRGIPDNLPKEPCKELSNQC